MTRPDETGGDIRQVLHFLGRRRWVILPVFLGVFLAVSAAALVLPNQYQSTASIFIEPQKVPEDYVRSTITSDIEARVRTVAQQMTSRTKLVQVIDELSLYPEEKAKKVPAEVLVTKMRRDLVVGVPDKRDKNQDFFQVSFSYSDPTKAMLSVSRLVNLFIEESLQVREEQAQGTTAFIEEELGILKAQLEKQEAAIRAYKQGHLGELPEQTDANLRMLETLQLQLAENLQTQRELDGRLVLLEQEITRMEQEAQRGSSLQQGSSSEAEAAIKPLLDKREKLVADISRMESSYTERHPDLLYARKELQNVEESLAKARQDLALRSPAPSPVPTPAASMEASRELTNLRRQWNDAKPRLASLQEEEKGLRQKVSLYQGRVEFSPRREQEIMALTRDYENTRKNYEDLHNKMLEAQLSENLEKRQKGESFRVLDPANLPERPFSPNRPKILALGLAGGMGSGLGLAFLLDALFPAFFSVKQLKTRVELPLIMGIPHIPTRGETRRRRILWAAGTAAGMVLLAGGLILVDRFVVGLGDLGRTMLENLKGMGL